MEMSQGWTNMISSTTIKNSITKRRDNLLPMCVVMLEGMTEIWLETLSLDLDYCRRANNVWYCSGVKPICWECTSDLEPSWLCWLLLQFALWYLNLNWGRKPYFL